MPLPVGTLYTNKELIDAALAQPGVLDSVEENQIANHYLYPYLSPADKVSERLFQKFIESAINSGADKNQIHENAVRHGYSLMVTAQLLCSTAFNQHHIDVGTLGEKSHLLAGLAHARTLRTFVSLAHTSNAFNRNIESMLGLRSAYTPSMQSPFIYNPTEGYFLPDPEYASEDKIDAIRGTGECPAVRHIPIIWHAVTDTLDRERFFDDDNTEQSTIEVI